MTDDKTAQTIGTTRAEALRKAGIMRRTMGWESDRYVAIVMARPTLDEVTLINLDNELRHDHEIDVRWE